MSFFKENILTKSKQNLIFKFFNGTLILLLFGQPSILSATKTWIGNTTDWNTSSNWNPASLPASTDDIVVPTTPMGGSMPTLNSGSFTIDRLTLNSSAILIISGGTLILRNDALINGTLNITSGNFDLSTYAQKITIDGGIFNQSGGIVSTRDMELKSGGVYNQTNGEFQISRDLRVPAGPPINTFNGTGGIVHFTGGARVRADYTGNVQFHNVLIDADADYNSNNNSDNIKISGNFTNNNPNLDNNNGTVTFNGSSPQTIYSASTPPGSNTTFGNLVVSNSTGVTLLSDLGVHTSITFNSGGYLNPNSNTIYLNGTIYDGPLPVELSSFSAVILKNGVKLKWRTETEVSNFGFEVQRSTANVQSQIWQSLGFVDGHGNSNSPKEYSFVDQNITAGKFSYRLKQIDTDGKFEYSKIIEVNLGSPNNYELSQNYPNPFNPSTTIRYSVSERSMINLSIFNSLGEKVEELENEVKEPGVYTIEFSAKNYPSGTYLYRIQSDNFTSVKKMILVK